MSKPHMFLSCIAARCAQLFSMAMFTVIAAENTWAAPSDGDMVVHHVRLEGTGFAKTHMELFKFVDQACRDMGKPPESIPAGENVYQIVKDIYYAAGGVTTYTNTKKYAVHPQACKLERSEKIEIKMRTAAGMCTINPERKRAVGMCDVQSLIAGKTAPVIDNPSIKPTGGTMTIAGLKCDVFAGSYMGVNKEYCVARTDSFIGMPEDTHSSRPGVLLKDVVWGHGQPGQKVMDMEAKQVMIDTTVKLEVLAPHIGGGYQVLPMGGSK